MPISLRVAVISASLFTSVLADCYFPNRKTAGADVPCNPNALVSACCFSGQACLSNGLCQSKPHRPAESRLHRGTCTDRTWQSANCPNHCTFINNNGSNVFSCNQTSVDAYCCGNGCSCEKDGGTWEVFTLPQEEVYTLTIIGETFTNTVMPTSLVSTSASTRVPAVSSSISSAATTSPSATATQQPLRSTPRSSTVAMGIGIGAGIGGALIAGIIAFFLWRRNKRRKSSPSFSPDATQQPLTRHDANLSEKPPSIGHLNYSANPAGYGPVELDANQEPRELDTDEKPQELEARPKPAKPSIPKSDA